MGIKVVVTVAAVILAASVKHAAPPRVPNPPTPIWQAEVYSIGWEKGPKTDRLALTPELVLSRSDGEDWIAALDRRTGKELWRRETPSAQPKSDGHPHVIGWQFVGAATLAPQESVVVLARYPTDGRDTFESVVGVEGSTGKTLWYLDLPRVPSIEAPQIHPVGVHGGILLLCTGDIQGTHWELRDAADGKLIDPASAAGKAKLQEATQRNGSRWELLITPTDGAALLDLASGAVRPVPTYAHLHYAALPPLMQATRDRLLFLLDMDNDSAGGSLAPKYILCTDYTGKGKWTFPKHITYSDEIGIAATPESSLEAMLPVPEAGVVLATDANRKTTAIRIANGAPVWSFRQNRRLIERWAAYHRGALVILGSRSSRDSGDRTLGYLDASTGRIRTLSHIPEVRELLVDRDDLFLVTRAGAIQRYDVRAPVGAHASARRGSKKGTTLYAGPLIVADPARATHR